MLEDIANGLIHKWPPIVSSIAGNALGGPAGVAVGSVDRNVAGYSTGNATGYGLNHNIHTPYDQLVAGVPVLIVTEESKTNVKSHGYRNRRKSKPGFQIDGGSYLAL